MVEPGPAEAQGQARGQARVVAVPYGPPALDALAGAVHRAQVGDALAPVTVVVPSNAAGLAARRALARDGGIANVAFVTPFELADRIGGAAAARAGVQPLTSAILAAAVRAQLADDPGPFQEVARHEATESALVAGYAELSRCREATLARLEHEGRWVGALVACFRAVQARLSGFADETARARFAREVLQDGAPPWIGTLVVHLPQPVAPTFADLLRDLADRVPTEMIVGLTGEDGADAAVIDACASLGVVVPVPAAPVPRVDALGLVEVVEVIDPDDEVRAVVREIVALAESGARLDRIALLYPVAEPYARIVHEQLTAAGVEWNGIGVRRLADRAAGRTLLRLLDLAGSDLRRADVVELLAGAPARDSAGPVAAHRWDVISRKAGVLGGRDDWARKLAARIEEGEERAVALVDDGARADALAAIERDVRETRRLASFVADLADRLGVEVPPTWAASAAWARALLVSVLGTEAERSGWPEAEQDAAGQVDAVLERIAALDGVDRPPDLARLRRAVAGELDADTGRVGRFGTGVLTGPLALGVGLDVDAVFVLGLAEGTCPALHQEDSLLTDAVRRATGGELPDRAAQVTAQRRDLLAALAAGSHRVLLTPRGDPRSGRVVTPSRWLFAMVADPDADPLTTLGFRTRELPGVRRVASFPAGVAAGPSATVEELDLARITARARASDGADGDPFVAATPGLRAGIEAQRARASSAFTRWDGNLAGAPVPSPVDSDVLSPTRLEPWATCPFRYFLAHVLHLGDVERPDEILDISPQERGSLVHDILEEFVREQVGRPAPARIQPGEPWPPEDRARLHGIADRHGARLQARGVTGRPLLWRLHLDELHADLDVFLEVDTAARAELGGVPDAVELSFGFEDGTAAEVALLDGRSLRFRGQIDRVDLDRDGAPIVIDYKTGKPYGHERVEQDPVDRGRLLQLPLYAAAAARRAGTPTGAAYYWFATVAGQGATYGYRLDDARDQRFREVLTEIVGGIEAGVFPVDPGEEAYPASFTSCRHCDFDRLCSPDRLVHADGKAGAPELVRFLGLRDGDHPVDEPDVDGTEGEA